MSGPAAARRTVFWRPHRLAVVPRARFAEAAEAGDRRLALAKRHVVAALPGVAEATVDRAPFVRVGVGRCRGRRCYGERCEHWRDETHGRSPCVAVSTRRNARRSARTGGAVLFWQLLFRLLDMPE